ncbi:MAG TPA: EamA family transporter RarD, partial [Pasteurellaceae bacterium]|nr:EamA family transporter RarD [Pasteurellaceae bacterium]
MVRGIVFSVLSSFLFGGVYYLSVLLQPISGEGLFGLRTLSTVPFLIFALFLMKQSKAFVNFLKQLKNEPHLILILLFTSFNMGIQMWLFLWAPNNGKAIEVSIGYLLMPLIMVIIGRFLYKERLSGIKVYAVLFATVGVASKIVLTGAFSWESALVCLGYPFYFAARKSFRILHLSSFVLEMLLLIPISIYFALQVDMNFVLQHNPNVYYWLLVLGVVSGVAFTLYLLCSQLLPINFLGLLGYLAFFLSFFFFFLFFYFLFFLIFRNKNNKYKIR